MKKKYNPVFGYKTCSVCGDDAGKYKQHYNRDTGYGICRRCVDRLIEKGTYTPEEIKRLYGAEGVHYASKSRKTKSNPKPIITTMRLTNKYRENGGEWYFDYDDKKMLAAIKKDLESARKEEPNWDWHLETRGTHVGWHRVKEGVMNNPRQRAPVHCPACGGEGRELGSLGYLRHFNCRDCGAQFSKKTRARRKKKISKNPAYRTRASTKKIIGAWLKARGGKGALRLGKMAGRRMRIKLSKSGNWVTRRGASKRRRSGR